MNNDFRSRFAELAALDDQQLKLDEAALVIAAETDGNIDIDFYINMLDTLAEKFTQKFDTTTSFGISVNALVNFIHEEESFTGNVKDYHDPNNSFLNRVLETRRGIPVTLALIHILLGSRLNIPVSGINFPGHFLVQYGNTKPEIIDPFSGRILSKPDCATLLKQLAGPRAVLRDEYFEAASNKEILIRILDNLKQIFWRKKAWKESKACIDRQLLLFPERLEFSIQLGAVHEMQGDLAQAKLTYVQVLQMSTDERVRNTASQRLLSMEARPHSVH